MAALPEAGTGHAVVTNIDDVAVEGPRRRVVVDPDADGVLGHVARVVHDAGLRPHPDQLIALVLIERIEVARPDAFGAVSDRPVQGW